MNPRTRGVFVFPLVQDAAMARIVRQYRRFLGDGSKLLLLVAMLLGLPLPAQAVFSTPGQFSVGADGSANYSIPIQIPPGTGGMVPKLSLDYNSNGGNGILGMGWGLTGLSQIGRCPMTIAQDGFRGGINYDANDKYCIDGQRLIATTGTYGADQTEYRTELANFARIISYGTAGNGPAWFKVWTKGGQIIEYGNTADSRIEAQGKATVRLWGVNKIADTKGNYLTVSYTEDNANGEAYVSRIEYTGNATTTPALTPYASVQFSYATRNDTTTDTLADSVIKVQHRITDIKTYNGSNPVKDYRLAYANNGAWHVNASNQADGSLLTQVQECDGASPTPNCQNPTNLTWTPGTVTTSAFGSVQNWGYGNKSLVLGDINGDGRADYVYSVNDWVYVGYSSGSSFTGASFLSGVNLTCLSINNYGMCTQWSSVSLGDVNGDGRADLITGNGYVRLSNGSGFDAAQNWGYGNKRLALEDINGDGRADYVYSTGDLVYVGYSTGTGFTSASLLSGVNLTCLSTNNYGVCTQWSSVSLGDVNGDGRADLITGNGYVRLSNGSGFDAAQNWGYGNKRLALEDINGDGRADYVYSVNDQVYVGYSSGSSFTDASLLSGVNLTCLATDMYGMCTQWSLVSLGDVSGDGLADLVSGDGKVRLSSAAVPDQLTSVTEGVGGITTVAYKDLSDTTGYTPETGAAYPIRDLLAAVPMYVVSSVISSDGLGGVVTSAYTYGGAKVDMSGRGSLGFRWMKTSSPDTGLSSTIFNRQDYPYIGLPYQVEKRVTGGTLLSVVQHTYANSDLVTGSATSKFPYASQTVEYSYELDGSLVTTTATNYQYDSYGNSTQINVNSSDGFVKTTINTYVNDTANWFLGRLLRSAVSSTVPDPAVIPVVTPAALSVTANPNPLVVNAPSPGTASGSASLTVSGGVAPYTYAWSRLSGSRISVSGAQAASFSVSLGSSENLTESFKVTVTDAAGKTTTTNLNVTFTTPTLSITASPSPLVVNAPAPGTASGSASLTVSGGTAPYTYTWTRLSGSRISVDGAQTGNFSASLGWGENLTESFRATVTDAVGNTNGIDLNVTFTTPAAFTFTATIAANATNYNLKNAAIAAGWDQAIPLKATVTINSGVVVGSTSTGSYAFDTGATFSAGTTLALINNGKILGAGGKGGDGGAPGNVITGVVYPQPGSAGGPAFRAQHAISVTNNGVIGGGGGGGAGEPVPGGYGNIYNANGGGGGQGFSGGAGGAAGTSGNQFNPASPGTDGTASSPGSLRGGALGSSGDPTVNQLTGVPYASGGSGGACTSGNGNITWIVIGSRYGTLN